MRTLLRNKTKEYEMIEAKLIEHMDSLLDLEPTAYDPEYEEFLNSIKTAMFMQEWIDERDEEFILNTYSVRPGEIRYKLNNADWLLYATEEITRMMGKKELLKEILKVRLRMKHGAKEELLPLLKLKGIGRRRARKLFTARIRDIAEIKKADVTSLVQLLGKAVAMSIKKQVGQKVEEIPKGTRKGQTSIKKF